MFVAAVAAGDKLRAEADAEHGLVGLAEGAVSAAARGQPRVLGVVEGALLAAEDDEAVVAGVVVRTGTRRQARRRSTSAPASASAWRDEAERSSDVVLDDEDAHAVPHTDQECPTW